MSKDMQSKFTEEITAKLQLKRKSYTVHYENDKQVRIQIETEENENFEVVYDVINSQDLMTRINENTLNIDYCYIKNIKYENIKNQIIYEISARYTFFDGAADFYQAKFGDGDLDFTGAQFGDEEVNFRQCDFGNGNVTFHKAQFGNGIISFSDSCFGEGNKDFSNIICGSGEIYYSGGDFGKGDVTFLGSVFAGEIVSFARTNFNDGKVDFCGAKFEGKQISFNGSTFGTGSKFFQTMELSAEFINFRWMDFGDGDVSFWCSKFGNSRLDFSNTKFGSGDINFRWVEFGLINVEFDNVNFGLGELVFQSALADNAKIRFWGCKLTNCANLRFKNIDTLEFLDCTVNGVLLLNEASDHDIQINKLSLSKTKNLGNIYINGDKAIDAISRYGVEKEDFLDKANQMKMLKENYHNIGENEWEDRAYVNYRRFLRKDINSKSSKEKKLIDYIKVAIDKVLDLIGEYGTSPGRVILTMLIVWGIGGGVFGIGLVKEIEWLKLSSDYVGDLGFIGKIIEGFYFSAITFLTIGYGDIAPFGIIAKILAPLQGFLGLFLMSYFTVAVVRKTLR